MGAGVRLVTQRELLCRVVMFLFLLGISWTPEADFLTICSWFVFGFVGKGRDLVSTL